MRFPRTHYEKQRTARYGILVALVAAWVGLVWIHGSVSYPHTAPTVALTVIAAGCAVYWWSAHGAALGVFVGGAALATPPITAVLLVFVAGTVITGTATWAGTDLTDVGAGAGIVAGVCVLAAYGYGLPALTALVVGVGSTYRSPADYVQTALDRVSEVAQ